MKSYLLFRQRDVFFDIPDDFPEDLIPEFMTYNEFLKWYKSNNFSSLEYYDYQDNGNVKVIAFNEDFYRTELPLNDIEIYNKRIKKIKQFFKRIQLNRHLYKGDFNEKMLSIHPLDFFNAFAEINLPLKAYRIYKEKLLFKFPNKTLKEIIKKFLTPILISSASEQFIEFLSEEKIDLYNLNFFELSFGNQGKIINTDYVDYYTTAPFSFKKMKMLLSMCNLKYSKKKEWSFLQNIISLINSNQFEKLDLLFTYNLLYPSIINKILVKVDNMPIFVKAKLLSVMEKTK